MRCIAGLFSKCCKRTNAVPVQVVPAARDMEFGTRVVVRIQGRKYSGTFRCADHNNRYSVKLDTEWGLMPFDKVELES